MKSSVSQSKCKAGSVVTIKSFRGEVIDSFQVTKFDGIKHCQMSSGMYAARYENAVAKANKIFDHQKMLGLI